MSEYTFNYYQYKKQINKNKPYNFTLIFLVIVLLLGICVFLRPKREQFSELYFVQSGEFQTYQQALNHSQEIASMGGAGYVYFENNYHVIAGFYSNHEDAKSVAEKLKNEYKASRIFSLKTKHFRKQKDLNSKQNESVENYVNQSQNIILKLEMLTNKYFEKSISFNELSIHFKNIKKDFEESYEKFNSTFKTNSKHNLTKEFAFEMLNSIGRILNISEEEPYSKLRYEIVNLVILRHQFLSCF